MKKDKKEVEYKEKAGTAWSHSYLNQKPWHPLSYPNQRRKWIAEQTHAQKEERRADVAREFAQEQEFFRQTAQMTKKEKEKMEAMQAVSFMYMRPPGYNAEAARAAELADERKKLGLGSAGATSTADSNAIVTTHDGETGTGVQENKRHRAKDVFGRTLPTEEEFPALKNAPRHDTGAPTRVKPFAIEIRNVKCARCGAFGHQSGDRECPLKDVLMPNEEARLIREDPLNVILAQTASDELPTWELKQKPGGLSPVRGGFKPDDPNQQIIPDEDIYDEYGGFLPGGGDEGTLSIPNLLASLSHEQRKELTDVNTENKHKKKKNKRKKEKKKLKHLDKRKNDSSEDEEKHSRPSGKRRSDIREGHRKKYNHGDARTSDGSDDDHGSKKLKGRIERDFYADDGKRHVSKVSSTPDMSLDRNGGGRPKGNTKLCSSDGKRSHTLRWKSECGFHMDGQRVDRSISNESFDYIVEDRKVLRWKMDGMDSDLEHRRLKHREGQKDSSDDEQKILMHKNARRYNSDSDERRHGHKLRHTKTVRKASENRMRH